MVRVSRLIRQLSKDGVMVFVVSHDFEFIVRTCSEVLQIDKPDSVRKRHLTPAILQELTEEYCK